MGDAKALVAKVAQKWIRALPLKIKKQIIFYSFYYRSPKKVFP
jgi:hypothetical protein